MTSHTHTKKRHKQYPSKPKSRVADLFITTLLIFLLIAIIELVFLLPSYYDTTATTSSIQELQASLPTAVELPITKFNKPIKIKNWAFCSVLKDAKFDALSHVYALNGSIATANPTHKQMVEIVETEAKKIYTKFDKILLKSAGKVDHNDLRRFSCYFAADGCNGMANITSERLLLHLNNEEYFPFLSFKENSWQLFDDQDEDFAESQRKYKQKALLERQNLSLSSLPEVTAPAPVEKKFYKIAYQILAHDSKSFRNIRALIERLRSPDTIILIHVDIKSKALREKLKMYIASEKKKGYDNIHFQKKCFGVIWGHISVVHAQIQGFFELLDLANWDYIINMSAYDWPLKQTKDIHKILKAEGNANWIEYWVDLESSATRFLRPHVTLDNYEGVTHPLESGLYFWPFSSFKAYKHHQWVILSRDFVEYIRTSEVASDMLAFMEHTWIPDESYFACLAVNLPQFRVISDSKRFIRFEGGWHPIWVTWKNRFDLLPQGKHDDGYFFARKVDIVVQPEFSKWIDENLYDVSIDTPCKKEDIVYRTKCFSDILGRLAAESTIDNSLIVISTNQERYNVVMNLYCTLQRLDMHKMVLFWSLDQKTHSDLTKKGILSYYSSNKFSGTPELEVWRNGTGKFVPVMRQKTKFWKMMLENELNFWFLDADTVVLEDFRDVLNPNADIHISIDEVADVSTILEKNLLPKFGSGMMHFRSTKRSLEFVNRVKKKMEEVPWMNDQYAINRVLTEDFYKERRTFEYLGLDGLEFPPNQDVALVIPQKLKQKKKNRFNDKLNFEEEQEGHAIKIAAFDQVQFANGQFYFPKERSKLKEYNRKLVIVHANGQYDKEKQFRLKGLWFLTSLDQCIFDLY